MQSLGQVPVVTPVTSRLVPVPPPDAAAPPVPTDLRRTAVLSGVSRVHVFETLRDAGGPVTAQDLADQVFLHVNTVRWHLDRLVEAGLVDRTTEATHAPGRPRLLYRVRPGPAATEDVAGPVDGYRLLAVVLAGYLADVVPDPAAAGDAAGRALGRFLVDKPRPFERLDLTDGVDRVVQLLHQLGFAPEPDQQSREITLHACPFREVALAHPDVACAVHLGIMQGALAELGLPPEAVTLTPFAGPATCRSRFDGATPLVPRTRPPSEPGPVRQPKEDIPDD